MTNIDEIMSTKKHVFRRLKGACGDLVGDIANICAQLEMAGATEDDIQEFSDYAEDVMEVMIEKIKSVIEDTMDSVRREQG